MIYFISDLHFFHQNIFEYEPIRKQFKNYISEITKRWNNVVKQEDIVFIVGDLFCGFNQFIRAYPQFQNFTEKEIAKNIISRLNGKKILIRGNHDKKTVSWYKDTGIDEVYDYLKFEHNGIKIGLCHYPLCENYLDNNTHLKEFKELLGECDIYIHGHTHSRNPCENYFNVSVENVDFTPISLEVIINKHKDML